VIEGDRGGHGVGISSLVSAYSSRPWHRPAKGTNADLQISQTTVIASEAKQTSLDRHAASRLAMTADCANRGMA
jgi:hypothetical protein